MAAGRNREPLLALAFRAGWTSDRGRVGLADLPAFAAAAEAAGADLLIAESEDRGAALAPDPVTVVSALIPSTRRIGLGAEIATSAWAPFNLARAFSALDLLSNGRSAWLATPGEDPPDRFAEHLQVVFALFDSWDADALVLDKADGLFTDPGKVRRIAHAGAHFTVDGPLNSPAPPQGRPLILQRAAAATDDADLVIGGDGPPDGARRLLDLGMGGRDPSAIADEIREGSWDGVMLKVAALEDLEMFTRDLAPKLAPRDLADSFPIQGQLRDRLGFPRLINEFSRIAELSHEA